MKIYAGFRTAADHNDLMLVVTFEDDDPSWPQMLQPMLDIYAHSNCGYEWGTAGNWGPAQLALAICCDHFGAPVGRQPALYMRFKDDIVAHWVEDRWVISAAEIQGWWNNKQEDGK